MFDLVRAAESHRFAVAFDVELGGLHIIERRFTFDKPQKLQTASRVVDIREHGTIRATILKPVMF